MSVFLHLCNEEAAWLFLEDQIWAGQPRCPHCTEQIRVGRLNGPKTPVGTWKCYVCRRCFTLRHQRIFEHSHVPLHVWLQALYLLVASRYQIGANRIEHVLGVSSRTAAHVKRRLQALQPGGGLPPNWIADTRPGTACSEDDTVSAYLAGQFDIRSPVSIDARFRRFILATHGLRTEATGKAFLAAIPSLVRILDDADFEAGNDQKVPLSTIVIPADLTDNW